MNGANGANGDPGSCVVDGNWKKQRKSRLMNRVNSPVAIKIEDDSDDDSLEKKINDVAISTGAVDTADKSVQTDNSTLMETLRKIVQERMQQYEAAALKDHCIDKQLSPLLEKLQRENEELRKHGFALKCQLDQKEKEKQSLKRRFGDIETDPGKSPTTSHPPPYTAATQNIYVPTTNIMAPRMNPPLRQTRPPPPHLVQSHQGNSSPVPPPPSLAQAQGNPTLTQPLSTNKTLSQPRPPAQVINNLRQIAPAQVQPIMRHPFAPNERFMLLGSNNITMNGINNTQVVSSNQAQGLRMTSMPPDINTNIIRSPIDTNARQMLANHQQYLQRMPGLNMLRPGQNNAINPQLRLPIPAQNTVRPMPPSGQNVPNIALPFSPLPKLTAAISTSNNAIVLTWDYHERMSDEKKEQFKVECYQLFAHQAKDARVAPPLDTKQWKKIGVVNALPLPMACTLTQFASGSVYFFAVVAVDIHGREGEMSNPCVIRLDVNQR